MIAMMIIMILTNKEWCRFIANINEYRNLFH